MLDNFTAALTKELLRALSGRLFTDAEIRGITSHAVGKYLKDWFPEPEKEQAARERVEEARHHIGQASEIIAGMQADLSQQTEQLDALLHEIEEKKSLAERYGRLAETNEKQFAAFREEIEATLREELIRQSEQGKAMRRAASIAIWTATLVAGAALGTYFKDIVQWVQAIAV